MPHQSGDDPEINNPEMIYRLYRDYIRHEDGLINRRSMSNTILQGFLFTAYSLTIEFLHRPMIDKDLLVDIKFLPLIFAFVGFTVGALSLMGIIAAENAIKGLTKGWENIAPLINVKRLARLPGLTGAGQKRSNTLAKVPQLGIVCVITIAWIPVLWSTQ